MVRRVAVVRMDRSELSGPRGLEVLGSAEAGVRDGGAVGRERGEERRFVRPRAYKTYLVDAGAISGCETHFHLIVPQVQVDRAGDLRPRGLVSFGPFSSPWPRRRGAPGPGDQPVPTRCPRSKYRARDSAVR